MKNYITYIYLDSTRSGSFHYDSFHFNYEPFYVGEGISGRELDHLKEAKNHSHPKYSNRHKFYKIKKLLSTGKFPIIVVISKNITKQTAQKLEIELIKRIGRKDVGNGPLLNLTNGGDVNPILFGIKNPMYGKRWSTKRKKEHSQKVKLRNRSLSKEDFDAIYRKPCKDETKQKMSIKMRGENNPMYGMKHSPKTIEQISHSLIGKMSGEKNPRCKQWKVTDPQNNEFVVKSLHTFCKERGMCADSLKLAGKENRRVGDGISKGWSAVSICS